MTTLTIIKDDKYVAVDGFGIHDIDVSSLAANIHAIQFDGTNGEIEYNDGKNNEAITSISAYSTITDLWTVAKAADDKRISDEAAALTALQATHGWKRTNDETTQYAFIGDQLDQLYADMLAGKLDATGTWAIGIKAVKDAHPKP